MVYIAEAHPVDEWRARYNDAEGICYRQPRSLDERLRVAGDFAGRYAVDVPLLVDCMDNEAELGYSAWPDRLYVVDEAGRIAYKGEPGPDRYRLSEVDAWLAHRFPAPSGATRDAVTPPGSC